MPAPMSVTTSTPMTLAQATEEIYRSIQNDNEDIDLHINNLKAAMAAEGRTEAVFQPSRLVQNNRQGRKIMEAFFRKRGVKVVFEG